MVVGLFGFVMTPIFVKNLFLIPGKTSYLNFTSPLLNLNMLFRRIFSWMPTYAFGRFVHPSSPERSAIIGEKEPVLIWFRAVDNIDSLRSPKARNLPGSNSQTWALGVSPSK